MVTEMKNVGPPKRPVSLIQTFPLHKDSEIAVGVLADLRTPRQAFEVCGFLESLRLAAKIVWVAEGRCER
jgi:hypothetical protein